MLHQCRNVFATLAASTAALWSFASIAAEPDAGPVDAIWRVQNLDVVYHSTRMHYSCHGLQSKITAILRAVGAHERVNVSGDCMSGDFVNHSSTQISFAAPVEATPAAVQAATTFDSRQRLVAQVLDQRLPTAVDVERFPAEWRKVSLSHGALRLERGDCDLLRALRRQVFPHLSIRMSNADWNCSEAVSRLKPRFEVIALLPAPIPMSAQVRPIP